MLDAGAAGACFFFFFLILVIIAMMMSRVFCVVFLFSFGDYCNDDVPLCRQEAAEGGYAAPSEDVPVYAGSGDDLGG